MKSADVVPVRRSVCLARSEAAPLPHARLGDEAPAGTCTGTERVSAPGKLPSQSSSLQVREMQRGHRAVQAASKQRLTEWRLSVPKPHTASLPKRKRWMCATERAMQFRRSGPDQKPSAPAKTECAIGCLEPFATPA